jgi:hypothetical protein
MKISNLKKKLLAKGLVFSLIGDLMAGMFFGVGYLVVDHFNDWIDTQSPAGVAAKTADGRSKSSLSHVRAHDAQLTTDRDSSK